MYLMLQWHEQGREMRPCCQTLQQLFKFTVQCIAIATNGDSGKLRMSILGMRYTVGATAHLDAYSIQIIRCTCALHHARPGQ